MAGFLDHFPPSAIGIRMIMFDEYGKDMEILASLRNQDDLTEYLLTSVVWTKEVSAPSKSGNSS